MCKTKIVIKPVTFAIYLAAQGMMWSWSWLLAHQVITKDPVMPPSAPHHMPTPRPIGGKGLMGGAPVSRLKDNVKFQWAPPKLMFKRALDIDWHIQTTCTSWSVGSTKCLFRIWGTATTGYWWSSWYCRSDHYDVYNNIALYKKVNFELSIQYPGLRWVWAAKSIWRRGPIPIKLSSSAGEESTTCSQGLQLLLQGHNSIGNLGGGHHQAGASSSYYGNHLGGIC